MDNNNMNFNDNEQNRSNNTNANKPSESTSDYNYQYNDRYDSQYSNQYGDPNNQGFGPNGYNDGYYYQQTMRIVDEQMRIRDSNSKATASLVFGIIALATAIYSYGFLLTPLWAILAILKGAKAQNIVFPNSASTKAKVGKIFGIVALGITALAWTMLVFVTIIYDLRSLM